LRAGHEEILRRLDEISPELPSSFVPEDLGSEAEELARTSAQEAAREAADQAARQAAQQAEETAAQRAAGARDAAFAALRDGLAGIDRARTQAEILAALLREAGRFASRAAVLLVRESELRGWGGQGFGDSEPAIRDLAFTPSDGSGWARLAEGQAAVRLSAAECAELCSRIEAPLPHDGVLIPLVLRDHVVAGLYADRLADQLSPEALQVLSYTAAMAIELQPFRERPFTPTLVLEGGASGSAAEVAEPALAAESPAASSATAEESAPAPILAEPEPEPVVAEPEPEPEPEPTPAAAEPEPEPAPVYQAEPEPDESLLTAAPAPWEEAIAPEPVPELEIPDAGIDTGLETEVEIEAEVEAEAEAVPEEIQPEPEPALEPSPAATVYQPIPLQAFQTASNVMPSIPEPPPPAVAAGASPDQTVLLPRTPFGSAPAAREVAPPAEVPAPTPIRPVPAAEPAPSSAAAAGGDGATPEVRPPRGVEGPGWAFSASRTAVSRSEEALHEEARRLARLLVSEIKLYNEEQVEEGRRKRDVYERLKEDIDRSRQMYEERVEPRILKSTDYFYQELVRILAAGDAKALGI